jgi:ferredoxin-thioredoxin reductase catalytic subunit
MADIHVLPINDLRDHEETRACWCEPYVLDEYEEFAGIPLDAVVVHNSADCREFIEAHGVQ